MDAMETKIHRLKLIVEVNIIYGNEKTLSKIANNLAGLFHLVQWSWK